ncbi:MAG: threonine synthase [Bacteroidetes bacterium]|nr:threonine synthase [Bacteroidota bacterium]
MRFYSTKDKEKLFSLSEAVLKGLPADNGLFMPERIPLLPESFWKNISDYSFGEIADTVASMYLSEDMPVETIRQITHEAMNFPVPLVQLDQHTHILELFHGPTLAFKDIGARFMARVMAWLNRNANEKLTILVATSGDTGSAVANGFFNVPGIEVIILYPSGKVSKLQEKQLTTLGGNITALEIQGTFDDCQRLVKSAFLDAQLSEKYRLSSANSINIARLIPQSFYYIDAWKQMQAIKKGPVVFSVPSGNFGNLTAGLLAKGMGLPVERFIAANNKNNSVLDYLQTGVYSPKLTIATISNAMDVGDPSNFARMIDMYDNAVGKMRLDIAGYSFSDEQTMEAMLELYQKAGYVIDPHGAVAYLGFKSWQKETGSNSQGIILGTAHPAKFKDVVEKTLKIEIELPGQLLEIADKTKKSTILNSDFNIFHQYLMQRK